MADETPAALDLEKIGGITDEKELNAELARLRQQPIETTGTAAAPPEGDIIPAAQETEAAPAPAAEAAPAAKPAEETVKPVEAEKPRDDAAWKRIRLLEKQLADMQRQREQPQQTEQPKVPTYEEDPAEFLKQRQAALEGELQRLRQREEMDARLNTIRSQEQEYERIKPDYREATKHLEQAEINDWQRSGMADVGLRQLSALVAAGKNGDPNARPYAQHVESIAQKPDVQRLAAEQNRDPEDVAMYLVARDTYLTQRRQMVWAGAEATGRNVAEIAYELAQSRGYQPKAAAPAAAAPAATQNPDAARARVLQQQQISEAANSLSESPSAEGAAQPRVIRNRADVVALDDNELDALIANGSYRNL